MTPRADESTEPEGEHITGGRCELCRSTNEKVKKKMRAAACLLCK